MFLWVCEIDNFRNDEMSAYFVHSNYCINLYPIETTTTETIYLG